MPAIPHRRSATDRRAAAKYRRKRAMRGGKTLTHMSLSDRRKLSKAMRKYAKKNKSFYRKLSRFREDIRDGVVEHDAATGHPIEFTRMVVEAAAAIRKESDAETARAFANLFTRKHPGYTTTDVGASAVMFEARLIAFHPPLWERFVETQLFDNDFVAVFRGEVSKSDFARLATDVNAFADVKMLLRAGDKNHESATVADISVVECKPKKGTAEAYRRITKSTDTEDLPKTKDDYGRVKESGGLDAETFEALYGVDAPDAVEVVDDHNGIPWHYNPATESWVPNFDAASKIDEAGAPVGWTWPVSALDDPKRPPMDALLKGDIDGGFKLLAKGDREVAAALKRLRPSLEKVMAKAKKKHAGDSRKQAWFISDFIGMQMQGAKPNPPTQQLMRECDLDPDAVAESMGYRLKASDRKVITDFVKGKTSSTGKNLSIEGDTLKNMGMGKAVIATRSKGKITPGNPAGNVSQTWVNAVRKAARDAGALSEDAVHEFLNIAARRRAARIKKIHRARMQAAGDREDRIAAANRQSLRPGVPKRRFESLGGAADDHPFDEAVGGVPGLSKWSMHAGGTSAPRNRDGDTYHGYTFATDHGTYHLDPVPGPRFKGYMLKFANQPVKGKGVHLNKGLWIDLGSNHSTPHKAVKAAQAHHDSIGTSESVVEDIAASLAKTVAKNNRKEFIGQVARPTALWMAKGDYDAKRAPKLATNLVKFAVRAMPHINGKPAHQTYTPDIRAKAAEKLAAVARKIKNSPEVKKTLPKKYGGEGLGRPDVKEGEDVYTARKRSVAEMYARVHNCALTEDLKLKHYNSGAVVQFKGKPRRYVVASVEVYNNPGQPKRYKYNLVALTGAVSGSAPSGVDQDELVLSKDQSKAFSGKIAQKLKHRFSQMQQSSKQYTGKEDQPYHHLMKPVDIPVETTTEAAPTGVELWPVGDHEKAALQFKKALEAVAPVVTVQAPALGGPERAGVLIRVILQPKDKWTNGIADNAPNFRMSIERNGEIEQFTRIFRGTKHFRKTRAKSFDDAVKKISKYIEQVKTTTESGVREATDMAKVKTIRDQIGHKAFVMMGAKNFVGASDDKGNPQLSFKIGKNAGGGNYMFVTLMPNDTYKVELQSVRMTGGGISRKVKKSDSNVYADQLHQTISSQTGMALSLGTMGKHKTEAEAPARSAPKVVYGNTVMDIKAVRDHLKREGKKPSEVLKIIQRLTPAEMVELDGEEVPMEHAIEQLLQDDYTPKRILTEVFDQWFGEGVVGIGPMASNHSYYVVGVTLATAAEANTVKKGLDKASFNPTGYTPRVERGKGGGYTVVTLIQGNTGAKAEQTMKGWLAGKGITAESITAEAAPSPALADKEAKARVVANDKGKLMTRFKDALSVMKPEAKARFKGAKLDFAKKRLVTSDGKVALQWALRKQPTDPESATNQQTTTGNVYVVDMTDIKARTKADVQVKASLKESVNSASNGLFSPSSQGGSPTFNVRESGRKKVRRVGESDGIETWEVDGDYYVKERGDDGKDHWYAVGEGKDSTVEVSDPTTEVMGTRRIKVNVQGKPRVVPAAGGFVVKLKTKGAAGAELFWTGNEWTTNGVVGHLAKLNTTGYPMLYADKAQAEREISSVDVGSVVTTYMGWGEDFDAASNVREGRVRLECMECGKKFSADPDKKEPRCPKCGSVDYEVAEGLRSVTPNTHHYFFIDAVFDTTEERDKVYAYVAKSSIAVRPTSKQSPGKARFEVRAVDEKEAIRALKAAVKSAGVDEGMMQLAGMDAARGLFPGNGGKRRKAKRPGMGGLRAENAEQMIQLLKARQTVPGGDVTEALSYGTMPKTPDALKAIFKEGGVTLKQVGSELHVQFPEYPDGPPPKLSGSKGAAAKMGDTIRSIVTPTFLAKTTIAQNVAHFTMEKGNKEKHGITGTRKKAGKPLTIMFSDKGKAAAFKRLVESEGFSSKAEMEAYLASLPEPKVTFPSIDDINAATNIKSLIEGKKHVSLFHSDDADAVDPYRIVYEDAVDTQVGQVDYDKNAPLPYYGVTMTVKDAAHVEAILKAMEEKGHESIIPGRYRTRVSGVTKKGNNELVVSVAAPTETAAAAAAMDTIQFAAEVAGVSDAPADCTGCSESITEDYTAPRKIGGPGKVKEGNGLAKRYAMYVSSGNVFEPTPVIQTHESLASHAYRVTLGYRGVEYHKVKPATDELYYFESGTMTEVLNEIDDFWSEDTRERFESFGLLHNRGILLHGIPGTGKSALLQQVVEQVTSAGDVVFFTKSVSAVKEAIKAMREVEPDRQVVVVLEDTDEHLGYEQQQLLQLMDGEDAQQHVLYLATTNYIERFPPRLLRPGRFDQLIEVGPPPEEGRRVYLENKLKGKADDKTIAKLVKETDGMTFGHLRELVIGAYALKQPVESVLKRLKAPRGRVFNESDESDAKPPKNLMDYIKPSGAALTLDLSDASWTDNDKLLAANLVIATAEPFGVKETRFKDGVLVIELHSNHDAPACMEKIVALLHGGATGEVTESVTTAKAVILDRVKGAGSKLMLSDISRDKRLHGVHFKQLQAAAKALAKKGSISYDGIAEVGPAGAEEATRKVVDDPDDDGSAKFAMAKAKAVRLQWMAEKDPREKDALKTIMVTWLGRARRRENPNAFKLPGGKKESTTEAAAAGQRLRMPGDDGTLATAAARLKKAKAQLKSGRKGESKAYLRDVVAYWQEVYDKRVAKEKAGKA